jgi:hypothetical protein
MDQCFQYTLEEKWPPLAWVAKCRESDPVIHVRHGPQVETRISWFCEAIWDDEFTSGNFDETDLVFGSGSRLRNGRVIFVSSGSTVDRLQFLQLDDKLWISNSLACLLAVSGIKVDTSYGRFPDFFRSIIRGIDAYEKELPTQAGRLELVYFRNLAWDGCQLLKEDKPFAQRDFSSFEKYRDFLRISVAKIAGNMQSADRKHRYEMVGGLSSGYDSTTVAVLAQEAGMKQVFSFQTARGGQQDHGEQVAGVLGLHLTLLDRRDWQQQPFAEVPYFAANGLGVDVIFASAQDLLRGRVMVSGFHGDKVWAKDTKALGPEIVRGDASGLAFTEHRLILGCIHCPMAFMGVREIRSIHALSTSTELAPWDLPGDYSRPVCRRIVEEAGVPRELFGMKKKAATNLFHRGEVLLTDNTREAYYRWLRENSGVWATSAADRPRIPGGTLLAVRNRYYLVEGFLRHAGRFLPAKQRSIVAKYNTKVQRWLNHRINLVRHLFPWAIERTSSEYIPTKKT